MKYRAIGLASLVAAGSFLLSAGVPASAASVMTEAFVANVRPNVDFLDRSSRLALDNSSNGGLRSFAHSEAVEQTIAANSLVAWTQTATVAGAFDAIGRPVEGPVDAAVALPLDTAAAVVTDVDGVVSGRSAAVDRPLTVTPAHREALLPAGADNLARLSALKGKAFDALYRNTQRDSLHQLSTLYSDYIANGDDPALRAMAIRELPKINRRMAELRRL